MSLVECLAALCAFVVVAWLFTGGLRWLWRAEQFTSCAADQKCPYCDTWQAEVGGWAWVGNSDNPMVDFAAECAECGMYSDWVWIGPGVCATYEEITKQQVNK